MKITHLNTSLLTVSNGEYLSRSNEGERKRNYKLLIDPVLKGRGHQKIYRFDGEFDGVSRVFEHNRLLGMFSNCYCFILLLISFSKLR